MSFIFNRASLRATLVGMALAALALGVAAGSARAQTTAGIASHPYVACDPLWEPGYNIDDTSASIAYRGSWKFEAPWQGQYMGTHHITNFGGATAAFTMPNGAFVLGFGFTRMRNAGLADVYYNDQKVATVDMYSPVTDANCYLMFDAPMPPGTLMIKAVNRRNPSSGGTYVNLDYVHYEAY